MPINIATILAVICAIVATVLAVIFIMPEKRRASLNGFGKLIHDICNFKFLIIEKILKIIYVFATAYCVLLGFFMLFSGRTSYYYGWDVTSSSFQSYAGYGILVIILGPIVIRIAYEIVMMTVLLVKNVIDINRKLGTPKDSNSQDIFGASITNLFTSQKKTCPRCSKALKANATFCSNCGANLTPPPPPSAPSSEQ